MVTRQPAVAGFFYPSDRSELRAQITSYLAQAKSFAPPPKAIIAPHAGTIYSGPVAASAYKSLLPVKEQIRRVVLMGPAHRVPFEGLAASSADAFATPLGTIPVDQQALTQAVQLPLVQVFDPAHHEEHSLELHLPFLQEVLSDFSLVPLVVGPCQPEVVADTLDTLWGGPETLLVISSDLSHYHPYEVAQRRDQDTAERIVRGAWQELKHNDACGFFPVRGFLLAASRHHLAVELVDLRNSADTAGSRDSVVGYGSFLFREAAA